MSWRPLIGWFISYFRIHGIQQGKLVGRGASSGTGVAELITLGTNLSMSGTTLNASGGGGGGGVTGPGSSVDNSVPRWNGTGGDTLQDSLVTIGDSGDVQAQGNFISGLNVASGVVSASGGFLALFASSVDGTSYGALVVQKEANLAGASQGSQATFNVLALANNVTYNFGDTGDYGDVYVAVKKADGLFDDSSFLTGATEQAFSLLGNTIQASKATRGCYFDIEAVFRITGNAVAGTFRPRLRFGGTGINGTIIADAMAITAVNGDRIKLKARVHVRDADATGLWTSDGQATVNLTTPITIPQAFFVGSTSADFTANINVYATSVQSVGANTIVCESFDLTPMGC